ncbi:MAG TPA: hypothetical protein VM939_01555 [Gemmatimonadaceae bacterium]|nr:hypothetical protein [Gemmatimonadaceae bacterium]
MPRIPLMGPTPAILFLVIAGYAGHQLSRYFLEGIDGSRSAVDRRFISPWVVSIPIAFLTGTLLVTWATYLVASALRDTARPLATSNFVVISIVVLALGVGAYQRKSRGSTSAQAPHTLGMRGRIRWPDLAILVTGLAVGGALMFHTCRMEGDTLVFGRTAFGDLNIHLGMARSFSEGQNFPTGYVAYAGSDIRYHFMFYFLVGNLEFLGLPLDWAVNLPSILSFTSVLLLLYALGSVLGRNWRVGAAAVVFFLMRSSPAILYYIAALPSDGFLGRIGAVMRTNRYIGLTTHEEWGIWNLNVYVVERHFAFAFGLVLLACLYLVRTTGLDSGPSLIRWFTARSRTPASVPD